MSVNINYFRTSSIRTRWQTLAFYAKRASGKTNKLFVNHQPLIDFTVNNLPALPLFSTIAGISATSMLTVVANMLAVIPFAFGICWEKPLRVDVANAVRLRVLKELTKEEGFSELIELAEPSIKKAIEEIFSELVKLESRGIYVYRSDFKARMSEFVDKVMVKAWKDIEPRIQDANKKARLRAWVDKLKGEMAGVDEVQKRAAEVLRETVREVLYDFNGKMEDQLGQSIPGEIEGDSNDKAMHILAETIVEKIMDRNLDYDIAIRRVIAEVVKEGIIDPHGQEGLVKDLLEAATSNDGRTNLKKLFDDFRKQYLDTGSGSLRLPRKAETQVVGEKKAVRRTAGLTTKEAKKDGCSN